MKPMKNLERTEAGKLATQERGNTLQRAFSRAFRCQLEKWSVIEVRVVLVLF